MDRKRNSSYAKPNMDRGDTKRPSNKRYKGNYASQSNYEDVIAPGPGCENTVSIAIPASILEETCLLDELRTYVVGQLARSAVIYSINEIVVYNDGCWRKKDSTGSKDSSQDCMDMMRTLLEYQECPQYLRKHLFSFHRHLSKVGILNALNAPHHFKSNQWCQYREGIVLEQNTKTQSYVDCGLDSEVMVDCKLQPGIRVTVKLPPEAQVMRKPYGTVVSPNEPRHKGGFYWGYTVRVADSLSQVFTESKFENGYDLLIGTSDKGIDSNHVKFPKYTNALIVFGGVDGIEAALETDSDLEASEPRHLFDYYVNTCPLQQSRTIRTEEAVLITLCALKGKLDKALLP